MFAPQGSGGRSGRRGQSISDSATTNVNCETAPTQHVPHGVVMEDAIPTQHERAWSLQRSSTSRQRTQECRRPKLACEGDGRGQPKKKRIGDARSITSTLRTQEVYVGGEHQSEKKRRGDVRLARSVPHRESGTSAKWTRLFRGREERDQTTDQATS